MNPATSEAKYHRGQDPSIWHYGHSGVRVSQNHQPLSRGVPKIGLSKITPQGPSTVWRVAGNQSRKHMTAFEQQEQELVLLTKIFIPRPLREPDKIVRRTS
jgi:hypothetical protein